MWTETMDNPRNTISDARQWFDEQKGNMWMRMLGIYNERGRLRGKDITNRLSFPENRPYSEASQLRGLNLTDRLWFK